jgi:hypothetical protein
MQQAGVDGGPVALSQTAAAVDIELASTTLLSASQLRQIKVVLQTLSKDARWTPSGTLRVSLPVTMPPDTLLSPCVPVLRRRRSTLWWPLVRVRHIVLAGDARLTLAAMVSALTTVANRNALTFALHDPEGELRSLALPQLAATSDALASARLHSLRRAWAAQHQQPTAPEPPLVLIAVTPDEIAWRDLAPLLADADAGVHVLVLLSASSGATEIRDACHQVSVIEVSGVEGVALPESHRPPGLLAPRTGDVLAWQSHRRTWRGTPICTDEHALATDWLSANTVAL